jgi:DNA-binding MarR family transcriptional regulator
MAARKQARRKTLVGDARAIVEGCTGLNVRLAARRIGRFLDVRLAETGFSIAQFGLMAHIAGNPEGTIGALAEQCGLDQSTLSRNLRGLEQAGLVEITTVEQDLRRRAVWLTETGARRLEAAIPVWRVAQAALAQVIASSEVRRLAAAAAVLPHAEDSGVGARSGLRPVPASPRSRSNRP